MDIFKQLSSGADVDMAMPEYAEAIQEMGRCNQICHRINITEPEMGKIHPMEEELFNGATIKNSIGKTLARFAIRSASCPKPRYHIIRRNHDLIR